MATAPLTPKVAAPSAECGSDFFLISKSDTVDFTYLIRGIYVGGTGDVVAVTEGNVAVTFSAVPAGTVLPVRARRVNASSTTATLMIGLY